MQSTSRFAPVVLRLGLAMVFVWFGLNQLLHPIDWLGFIPSWATSLSGLSTNTLVFINGLFEVAMAILLAVGIQIRVVAWLLAAHMLLIVTDVGLNQIGIRDVGLLAGLISVALHGADIYSFDA